MHTSVGIGARLREERQRVGFTQQELADRSGIDRNSQINYEHGHRSPPADYLAAVDRLGLDACYIVTGRRAPLA